MSGLAVLDMDGTLLTKRTIDVLCNELGLTQKLLDIDKLSSQLEAWQVSAKIAQLFAGIHQSRLLHLFETIPTVPGIEEFVTFLKSIEFIPVIITDSYTFLARRLAQKIGIQTVKANELETFRGLITGKLIMPMGWTQETMKTCRKAAICKLCAMKELIREYSIKNNRTLAVGDSLNDLCVIREAKIGVAFRPKDACLIREATVVINSDFYDLIKWLKVNLKNSK